MVPGLIPCFPFEICFAILRRGLVLRCFKVKLLADCLDWYLCLRDKHFEVVLILAEILISLNFAKRDDSFVRMGCFIMRQNAYLLLPLSYDNIFPKREIFIRLRLMFIFMVAELFFM